MEENKEKVSCCENNCCENKENCNHVCKKCCCNWKKCHLIKKLVWVVLIIIAFCAGSQWGEMKAKTDRGFMFERGGMGGWNYDKFQGKNLNQPTESVTVKVIPQNEVKQ